MFSELPFTPSNAPTWADVLPSPCIVLLGEAGSGKTSELRGQAERLREEGQDAFFFRVEELAKNGLKAAFEGDFDVIERWKQSSNEGWLFLDSVDEAKLHSLTLQNAIKNLENELKNELSRCHVIVSCRHSDWHKEDQSSLERFANKLIKKQTKEVQTNRRSFLRRSHPSFNGLEPEPNAPIRFLQLASLSREQIQIYAEQKEGLRNSGDFISALGKGNLWGLAGRPLDIEWLAGSWRRRRAFGSLRAMIEENIHEKLADQRDTILFPCPISMDKAREGIERIALALTMSGESTVATLGAARFAKTALDPRRILSWKSEEIDGLLRLSIFDPATYGRVRFHHRMVREYLAASCLRRLRRHNLTAKQLEELLFPAVEERRFVRPGFEAITAWLAIDDPEVRRQAVQLAPEHLMDLGDPSELPTETRRQILRGYAARFKGRKRTLHSFDSAGLERFVDEDLVPELRASLGSHSSDDLRNGLLAAVQRKRITCLAADALKIAQEEKIPSFLRSRAIRAVAEVGTIAQKRMLADAMTSRFATNIDVASELLDKLLTDTLTLDQVVTLLEVIS